MTQSMEFWGVEVKSGEPISATPGDDKVIHLSQACLGEVKKGHESESVNLYVKIGGQKHVLGRLNREKFPQISFDLVFEKEFELSHNWKNGSVYFCGYKSEIPADPSEDSDFEEYPVHEELPAVAVNNESEAKPVAEKANASKSVSTSAKQKVKIVEPRKDDGTSTEDSESDDSDAEDQVMANGESMSDDDDESEDDESSDEEEETPKKKVEQSKKRPMESATPAPEKKAKFVTPQRTDGKRSVVHVATPYPSKHASKASASNEQAKAAKLPGPKSSGDIACKSCSRSFKTEQALQAHSKAKHSAAA